MGGSELEETEQNDVEVIVESNQYLGDGNIDAVGELGGVLVVTSEDGVAGLLRKRHKVLRMACEREGGGRTEVRGGA